MMSAPPRGSRLWHDRRFVRYWTSHGVSQVGDRVSEIALPLVAVLTLDASPTEVGVVTAAVWAPHLVSLVLGAWVDGRPHKRRLLVVSDLVQAGGVAVVPVAYVLDALTLPVLVTAALVSGLGGVLHQTAYPPFFVSLVRRDQFLEANSLLSTTRSGSFVVGPAIGGQLVSLLTAPVAMVVDAVSFLVSSFLVATVRTAEPPPAVPTGSGFLARTVEGMRFVVRHPYLSASLACCTTLNFFSFVVTALVVLYASRTLGLSPGLIGLALGAGAVGGVLGAVVATRVTRRIGLGRTVVVGAVLFSLPAAALPLAAGPDLARAAVLAGVELVSGAGIMLFDINLNSLQAAVTPDAMRSRAAGAFSTVNYGVRPLGAVVGGAVADQVGVGPTIAVAAVAGALCVLWLLGSPIPGTRRLEEIDEQGRDPAVPSAP